MLPRRIVGAVVAGACLAVLIVASAVEPSPYGHGTHTKLGLPPCGWALYFKKPCVTCGMTTAFAHAVRLEFVSAFRSQPFGLVLAVLSGCGVWAGLAGLVFGADLVRLGAWLFAGRRIIPWIVALLAGWAYTWATWGG